MKYIRRYNESSTIKATNETIKEIVINEIEKLGKRADLNHIDVSEVTEMTRIFYDYTFNGDISLWDVGNVINMERMFSISSFNGNISDWNVINVRYMSWMFYEAPFNGDLSGWNVSNVKSFYGMFLDSSLEGRGPWWYVLYPLFGSSYLMWDSMDLKWIDLERKIIYRERLSKILRRSYNREWDGILPEVFGFTYK